MEVQTVCKKARQPLDRSAKAAQNRLDGLELYRKPAVMKRMADTPLKLRGSYVQAVLGKASPRRAIRAHCYECMGWDPQAAKGCTAYACPLWAYGPAKPATRGRVQRTQSAPKAMTIVGCVSKGLPMQ